MIEKALIICGVVGLLMFGISACKKSIPVLCKGDLVCMQTFNECLKEHKVCVVHLPR